ncbi:MAG: flavodoxin-dependent (E)-4-hydroxy-3-methylbut-2-enyl-diphosphate synthase [Candidatus Gastranaerophilales bacterium]|nr:flavodoxin-dependent (E)-4-hydroxy-3-methylbut-2-enyl-diphosphate synthase [Candidatus Gastranaerophilales bacterium]
MRERRKTRKINIGGVEIGGDAPISVQSMCCTDTRDVKSTVAQIKKLEDAGCELIRVAIPDQQAASALAEIKKQIKIPIIADIHFDYRLALESIANGADALRLNPGNIGRREFVEKVVKAAKERSIPIRIGVNAGSLQKGLSHAPDELANSLVESAMVHIRILEELDFDLIKVSLKASDVATMIDAYRKFSQMLDYPLHIGVTEAGTLKTGLIKSSIGIGSLLNEGIGDTIRVSLTEDPVEEVYAGWGILKSLNLRNRGLSLISCPTCGRCGIDLFSLAKRVEERFKNIKKPLTIAVMGCPVNGPGEARYADIGVSGANGEGYIFKNGEIVERLPYEMILERLEQEVCALTS